MAYGGVGLLCPGCAQLLFAQPKPSGSSELAATWFALLAITFFFNLIRHLKFLQDPEKCPHLKLIRSKEGAAPGAELASQYVKLRQDGAIIPSGLGLG